MAAPPSGQLGGVLPDERACHLDAAHDGKPACQLLWQQPVGRPGGRPQHRRMLTIKSAGAQITHICRHHRWRHQAPAADHNGEYCLVGGPLGLVTVGEGFWDREVVAGPAASGCPGPGAGVARGRWPGGGAGVFLDEMDAGHCHLGLIARRGRNPDSAAGRRGHAQPRPRRDARPGGQSGPVLAGLALGGRPLRRAGLGGEGPQGRHLAAVADHDEDLPACDLRRGRRVGAEFPARVAHGQHQGPGLVVDPGAAQRLPGQR